MKPEEMMKLMGNSKIYDLSHAFHRNMPQYTFLVPFVFTQASQHGNRMFEGNITTASELICLTCHIGTHIDSLGHVAKEGKLFGGIDASKVQGGLDGLKVLGMETVPPIIKMGMLLDVATSKGVNVLSQGYVITDRDLQQTAEAERLVIPEDCLVFIRTGWATYWNDSVKYCDLSGGIPGPDLSAAKWLAERRIFGTGADTGMYEAQKGNMSVSVHGFLLAEKGIYILENLNLEELARDKRYVFMTVVLPLKIRGATGSPIRPIAIGTPLGGLSSDRCLS